MIKKLDRRQISAIREVMGKTGWDHYETITKMESMSEQKGLPFRLLTKADMWRDYKSKCADRLAAYMDGQETASAASEQIDRERIDEIFFSEEQKRAIEQIQSGVITFRTIADYLQIKIPDELLQREDNLVGKIAFRPNRCKPDGVFFCVEKKYVNPERVKKLKPLCIIGYPKSEEAFAETGVPFVACPYIGTYVLDMSHLWRKNFAAKVIGISGSVGKTSTSDMVGRVAGAGKKMYKIEGNQNTTWQISGIVYNLKPEHEVYLQEASGSFLGQLERSSRILEPDIFIITNIKNVHLEKYDGRKEFLLYEKMALDRHAAPGAIGVINWDDPMLKKAPYEHKIVSYAMEDPNADFYSTSIVEKDGKILFDVLEKDGRRTPVVLNAIGLHNVSNALSAFAVGVALGIDRETIVKAIATYKTSGVRQNLTWLGGQHVYLDCYNASEDSIKGILRTMGTISVQPGKRKIAVLGDVLELGAISEQSHRRIGQAVAELATVDEAFFYGPESRFAFEECTKAGVTCRHTTDKAELIRWIKEDTEDQDLLCFKASHGMLFSSVLDEVYGTDFYLMDEATINAKSVSEDGLSFKAVEAYGCSLTGVKHGVTEVSIPAMMNELYVRTIGRGAFKNACVTNISIPSSVVCIAPGAFEGCQTVTNIVLPESVRHIGDGAFVDCTGLVSVMIGEGCRHIGERAFENCTALRMVEMPDSVCYIADDAFKGCDQATIVCAEGTYAAAFAASHGIACCHSAEELKTQCPELKNALERTAKEKARMTRRKAREEKEAQEQAAYVAAVAKAAGWSEEKAREKMDRAFGISGVSYEHYLLYRFWELTDEEQKTYFSKGDADKLNKKFNKDRVQKRMIMQKDLFCKAFEKYLGRPVVPTAELTEEVFTDIFAPLGKVIYKPSNLSAGKGIRTFRFDGGTAGDVFDEIKTLDNGVVEGFLNQHSEMSRLSVNAVNTIRLVTVMSNEPMTGIEPGKIYFVYAGVRMAADDGYVDNLHQGGLTACVNLETGCVETDGVNFANEVYAEHPATKVKIKGFQIPMFSEVKHLVEEAGKDLPGWLGWDIAITENGPVIVEINTNTGADVLQMPFVPMKQGVRYLVEKFLQAEPIVTKAPTKKAAKATGRTEDIQPETPYGTKISAITKEGIQFYWKKLERADGYEIFRGYKAKGKLTKIARIESRRIGTYLDTEFDHSKKKIYYSVRSFVNNLDGSVTYSEKVPPKAAVYRNTLRLERKETYMYSCTTRTMRAFIGWGEPEDAEWISDNDSVATVAADGTITAVSSGRCTITCTTKAYQQSATTDVIVDRKACEPLGEITARYHYNAANGIWEQNAPATTNDAVIMMVGDMMCGKKQMETQWSETGGWNFNDSFAYCRRIMKKSDLAVGNLETLLAAGWPYMLDETYIDNMNNCNATSRYLDAVKYGKFDAVVMANNHNCDGGTLALQETIDQVDRYQLAHTGAFKSVDERRFFIADVNGIKVGYLAYMSAATGFNGKDASWSKAEKDVLLNIFTPEKAARDIAACKEAGAEYIITYMHWGMKNYRKPTKVQLKEAQEIVDAGADYVVGANPHVLQMYDVLRSKDGREVPCFYSTGNFQSIMQQIPENPDSVIVRIRLKRNANGKVVLMENNYIPCYTYQNRNGHRWAPVAVCTRFHKLVRKPERKEVYARIVKTIGDKIKSM